MDYSLAKQLKDAGFPQRENGVIYEHYVKEPESEEKIYSPTLSELIEACGDKFMGLHHYADTKTWLAVSDENTYVNAPTPEEAVAKLWLELNKK